MQGCRAKKHARRFRGCHDRSLHFEDLFLCDEGMGGMIEIDIFDVQVCQQRFSIPELELGIVPRLFAKKGSLDSSRKNA